MVADNVVSQRATQQRASKGSFKGFAKGSAKDFSRGLISQDYLGIYARTRKEANPKIPKMGGKDWKYFSVENSFHLWG